MKREIQIPQESLVRIFIGGEFFSSLLCTPRDIKELAVGWLYNQGVVQSIDEIASIGACDDVRDIHVHLTTIRYKEKDRNDLIRTSACMGGEIPYSEFFTPMDRMTGGPIVSIAVLKSLMKKTLSMASSYREAGGIHCAGIASCTGEEILACFEDVGRHNAVDKVIGRMLLARQSPEDTLLLTSGRLSSEMALKAARKRIPILASITTGTDLALRMAENAGLTLVGRVLSAKPVVWCGEQRILS